MQVCRFRDPRSFLDRAEAFLMRAEVEHIVLLSIAGPPCTPPPVLDEDSYLAVVEYGRDVVACAARF
jgi:hypothetical protein